MNILVEEWGGKYQSQEISAKKGLNVDLLLEKILLEADLLNLRANPNREASGTIIEASLDKGRGYVATVLVQNGTLRQSDLMVSGQYFGRLKALTNERNQRVTEVPPSAPVPAVRPAPQAVIPDRDARTRRPRSARRDRSPARPEPGSSEPPRTSPRSPRPARATAATSRGSG